MLSLFYKGGTIYITVEVPCRSTTRELLVKELFSPTNMKRSGKKGYYIRTELSLDEIYIKLESRDQDLVDKNISKVYIMAAKHKSADMNSVRRTIIFDSSLEESEKIVYKYYMEDEFKTAACNIASNYARGAYILGNIKL